MKSSGPNVSLTWEEYQRLMRSAGLSASRAGIQDVIRLLDLYTQLENAVDKQAREAWIQAIAEFKQKKQ